MLKKALVFFPALFLVGSLTVPLASAETVIVKKGHPHHRVHHDRKVVIKHD